MIVEGCNLEGNVIPAERIAAALAWEAEGLFVFRRSSSLPFVHLYTCNTPVAPVFLQRPSIETYHLQVISHLV